MASWKTPPFISDVHHDQRSSTPKSTHGVPYELLFAANESDILENGSPASQTDPQQPPKPSVKRKLDFDENSSFRRKTRQLENRIAGPSTTASETHSRGLCDTIQSLPADMVVLDVPPPVREDNESIKWSRAQIKAFYEAVHECGLDFPSVVECMKRRLQKNLGKHARGKSLQAVHKYFLGIIKEVTDILNMKDSTEAFLTYAVINFGAWIEKVPGKIGKNRDYFVELFRSGTTTFTARARDEECTAGFPTSTPPKSLHTFDVSTPLCAALKNLHLSEDFSRLPSVVQVKLRPRSAISWANVQRSGQSPLLSIAMPHSCTIKLLADFLHRHWRIERTERRYLNAEIPEFTLRPAVPLSDLHFPTAMPDFSVFLSKQPRLCWYAFDRYSKKYPYHEALLRQLKNPTKEMVLCHDTFDHGNPYYDDDALQEEPEHSDEDDLDSTIVEKTNGNGYNPRVLFKEYFDEKGNVVWSSNKHHFVSVAELYLIAGRDSILLLDYDWIIPEEENYMIPSHLFEREELTDKARRVLHIKLPSQPTPPEAHQTEARGIPQTSRNPLYPATVQQTSLESPQKLRSSPRKKSPQKHVSFGELPHFDMISPPTSAEASQKVQAVSNEVPGPILENTVSQQEVTISHENVDMLSQFLQTQPCVVNSTFQMALPHSVGSPMTTLAFVTENGQNFTIQNSSSCIIQMPDGSVYIPVTAVPPNCVLSATTTTDPQSPLNFSGLLTVVDQGQAPVQSQHSAVLANPSTLQPPQKASTPRSAAVPKAKKAMGRPVKANTSNSRVIPSSSSILKTILPKAQR